MQEHIKQEIYIGFRTTRDNDNFLEQLVKENVFGADRTKSYVINQIIKEYQAKINK